MVWQLFELSIDFYSLCLHLALNYYLNSACMEKLTYTKAFTDVN